MQNLAVLGWWFLDDVEEHVASACDAKALGNVQVLRQYVLGEGGSEPKCWCFGGGRGLSQNDDMLTLWREGVEELRYRAIIAVYDIWNYQ